MKKGKRYLEAAKLVDSSKVYEVKEAFENFGDGGGPTPNIENITF
jgi:hypothetical protein